MSECRTRLFVITLRSLQPDDETTRNIRWLLKKALRQWGFRCISLEEKSDEQGDDYV